jgi:hypothetical protein
LDHHPRSWLSVYRPLIRFFGHHPRLTTGVAATAAAACAMAASASPAAAATSPSLVSALTWPTVQAHHAARPATRPAPRPAKQEQDYTFYDSITPAEIPAGHEIATYADGDYAVPQSAVAGRGDVIWIDVSGNDANATALDVEPGNATPQDAASWTWRKLSAHPDELAIIYTMRSEWTATEDAVDTLPSWMRSRVRWWIADPTGVAHLVPGSQATQWYWGADYDISTAAPGF